MLAHHSQCKLEIESGNRRSQQLSGSLRFIDEENPMSRDSPTNELMLSSLV